MPHLEVVTWKCLRCGLINVHEACEDRMYLCANCKHPELVSPSADAPLDGNLVLGANE